MVHSFSIGDEYKGEGTWPAHKASVYFVKKASNCKVHGIANGAFCLADGMQEPHKFQAKCYEGRTAVCSW